MKHIDPVRVSLFAGIIAGICDEMGAVLQFSALAANIKDRRDFSAAVFNAAGELCGMGAHLPVHLGAMPYAVAAAKEIDPGAGDMVILNDPYRGGTHLPDITMVAPIYIEGVLIAYAAVRAHHADVGGVQPGSMPLVDNIHDEGVIIPPTRLVDGGKVCEDVLDSILGQVRNSDERLADFQAQMASVKAGIERLETLCLSRGKAEIADAFAEQLDLSENQVGEFIGNLKPGRFTAETFMEDDGFGSRPVRIAGSIDIDAEHIGFDLTDSAPQTRGGINAPKAVTLSALLYSVAVASGGTIRPNAGVLRKINLKTKPGTIVDPEFPAACAGGNVETSQRLVEFYFDLLGEAGALVPAASQGTMNNVSMGWGKLNYYETIAGGCGASGSKPGADATHSHMTNSLNTPIEAIEEIYPLRIERYSVRNGSGGEGKYRGGDGVIREYRFLEPTTVNLLSERRVSSPPGRDGGSDGTPGKNILIKPDGSEIILPSKGAFPVERGEILRIKTPGGGGYGDIKG